MDFERLHQNADAHAMCSIRKTNYTTADTRNDVHSAPDERLDYFMTSIRF